MTVNLVKTKRKNEVELYYKNNLIDILYFNESDKTFGVVVDGDSFWDFKTKEKAIGKALHYYGYTRNDQKQHTK